MIIVGLGALVFAHKSASAAPGGGSTGGGTPGGGTPLSGSTPNTTPGVASTAQPATPPLPPAGSNLDQLGTLVANAIATNDPNAMRQLADQLEARGFKTAADSLRDEAAKIEAGIPITPTPPPPAPLPPNLKNPNVAVPATPPAPPAPTVPAGFPPVAPIPGATPGGIPPINLPGMTIPGTAPTPGGGINIQDDPTRFEANRLTQMLLAIGGLSGRGKEDKSIVREYQASEGLGADGLYGPGTAKTVLQNHGIIPVAPFWWSSRGASAVQAQKNDFVAAVRAAQSGDPQRSSQYDKLIADTLRS
jgi:hypothetical protein